MNAQNLMSNLVTKAFVGTLWGAFLGSIVGNVIFNGGPFPFSNYFPFLQENWIRVNFLLKPFLGLRGEVGIILGSFMGAYLVCRFGHYVVAGILTASLVGIFTGVLVGVILAIFVYPRVKASQLKVAGWARAQFIEDLTPSWHEVGFRFAVPLFSLLGLLIGLGYHVWRTVLLRYFQRLEEKAPMDQKHEL
jgi:hypothetical protein